MPKTKSASNSTTEKVMIIIALAAIAIFLMTLKSTVPAKVDMEPQPAITDPQGLDDATLELNQVDLDQIDSDINSLSL